MNIPNTQNFFNPDYDKHGDGYIPDAMNKKTSASNNFTMQTQDLHERMSAASENEKNLNKYSNASGIIDNSNVNNSNPTANIVQQQVQQMSAPLQENRPTVIRSPASDMNATTVRMDMKGNVIQNPVIDNHNAAVQMNVLNNFNSPNHQFDFGNNNNDKANSNPTNSFNSPGSPDSSEYGHSYSGSNENGPASSANTAEEFLQQLNINDNVTKNKMNTVNINPMDTMRGSDIYTGYKKIKDMSELAAIPAASVLTSLQAKIKLGRSYTKSEANALNKALHDNGLRKIDTIPKIKHGEVAFNLETIARKAGCKKIIIERNLAKNVRDGYFTGVRADGSTIRISFSQIDKMNIDYSGFGKTDAKTYFSTYLTHKNAKQLTAVQNGKLIAELCERSNTLSRLNINNMSATQLKRAYNSYISSNTENSFAVNEKNAKIDTYNPWKNIKISDNDLAVIDHMIAVKQESEVAKRSLGLNGRTKKAYQKEAARQIQDSDIYQGYSTIHQSYTTLRNTIQAPYRMNESYHARNKRNLRRKNNKYEKQAFKANKQKQKYQRKLNNPKTSLENSAKYEQEITKSNKLIEKYHTKSDIVQEKFEKLYGKDGKITKRQERLSRFDKNKRKENRKLKKRGKKYSRKLNKNNVERKKLKQVAKDTAKAVLNIASNLLKSKAFLIAAAGLAGMVFLMAIFSSVSTSINSAVKNISDSQQSENSLGNSFLNTATVVNNYSDALTEASANNNAIAVEKRLYDTFHNIYNEFTNADVAGVLGNVYYDTNYNPYYMDDSHFGIAKWDGEQWDALLEYCSAKGLDPYNPNDTEGSLNAQMQYLAEHIKDRYPTEYEDTLDNAGHAAEYYFYNFINAFDDGSLGGRIEKAKEIYNKMLAWDLYYMVDGSPNTQLTGTAVADLSAVYRGEKFNKNVPADSDNNDWSAGYIKSLIEQAHLDIDNGVFASSSAMAYKDFAEANHCFITRNEAIEHKEWIKQGYIAVFSGNFYNNNPDNEEEGRAALFITSDNDNNFAVIEGSSYGANHVYKNEQWTAVGVYGNENDKTICSKIYSYDNSSLLGFYAWHSCDKPYDSEDNWNDGNDNWDSDDGWNDNWNDSSDSSDSSGDFSNDNSYWDDYDWGNTGSSDDDNPYLNDPEW